jgi:hypothetical protein
LLTNAIINTRTLTGYLLLHVGLLAWKLAGRAIPSDHPARSFVTGSTSTVGVTARRAARYKPDGTRIKAAQVLAWTGAAAAAGTLMALEIATSFG